MVHQEHISNDRLLPVGGILPVPSSHVLALSLILEPYRAGVVESLVPHEQTGLHLQILPTIVGILNVRP